MKMPQTPGLPSYLSNVGPFFSLVTLKPHKIPNLKKLACYKLVKPRPVDFMGPRRPINQILLTPAEEKKKSVQVDGASMNTDAATFAY